MRHLLYPLKFEPVYKEIIWGGTKIREHFHRKTPFERVAESWELCCRPDGMGVVSNGELKGKTLGQLIGEYGEKLLGAASVKRYGRELPLLIKIIDANDRLSVQVHPDDAHAKKVGEKNGKNELWYIIDAKPGAKLIYGLLNGVTKEEFAAAVESGRIASTLREVPVEKGDFLYIPAGTVHAILDGILIAEIQQNSNTTYRIYDWDRVGADGRPRELHIDRALEVIAFDRSLAEKIAGKLTEYGDYSRRELLRSAFFNLDELVLGGKFEGEVVGDSFAVLMNLGDKVSISYDGGELALAAGDTVLLPACLGSYRLEGKSKLLLSWI